MTVTLLNYIKNCIIRTFLAASYHIGINLDKKRDSLEDTRVAKEPKLHRHKHHSAYSLCLSVSLSLQKASNQDRKHD